VGQTSDSFPIKKRFEIRRLLGAGGFGEVYEAFDLQRNETVALKILRKTDATTLYRFKQEFRALSLLAHPNLVTLYELIADDDQWLLTMELVPGGSFLDYVRPPLIRPTGDTPISIPTMDSKAVTVAQVAPSQRLHGDPTVRVAFPLEELHVDRLRSALRQLAEGVDALHRNHVLHLDIKPPNVLVDANGRVVLVDFGLAQQLAADSDRTVRSREVLGTPEFMSPEQAAAESLTEASDWYSVGALLYRALTGLAVFAGQSPHVLYDKLQHEATPPSDLVAGLPEDLDRLCRDLLRRNPAQRPAGHEVLARLGSTAADGTGPIDVISPPRTATFVGRESHLSRLRSAFDSMTKGRAATVYVHGRSGMGKTALVTHFLTTLRRAEAGLMVLEGRCYEHEAVPFKAFDSVLDALSDQLRRWPGAEVARLLPRRVEVLARVFPALRRVDAIAMARDRARGGADPKELRRRAFAALREFFGRLAERQPLVVFIDDLQWGDVDSAMLLDDLLRPPDSPPLMLVASYRSDETESSACLRVLLTADQSRGPAEKAEHIEVAELNQEESMALALALRPSDAVDPRIDTIAREAQGSPFFIDQLARHTVDSPVDGGTLDAVLWTRASQLPAPSRRFMEVVAVAGRPIEISIVAAAAGIESGKYDVFSSLRAARLLRSRARAEGTEVESYHDRIRETFVAHLSAANLAEHHLRLGRALEASLSSDAEAMALHFHAGGDLVRAARHAIVGAERSVAALAFDGAARLYRLALECGGGDPDAAHLRIKLGNALALAGRVRESAEQYLAALEGVDATEGIDLRRRAGEQYLLGGYVQDGLGLLKSTLADMGMTLPATTTRAFLALVLRQIYLRVRGIGFRARPQSEIPRFELQRLDMCHAVCRGLGFTDSIRAIELQTRHLLLALKAGDVYRVARALTFSATADGLRASTRPRAERLLRRASELATQVGSPHAIGLVHSTSGFVNMAAGRWQNAIDELTRAEAIFREELAGDTMPYETVLSFVYKLEALYLAGELKEYFRAIPGCLAECQGRGDIFAEASMRLRSSHRQCFAEDDVEGAARELDAAVAAWGNETHLLSRGNHLYRQVELAQYSGDFERGWQLLTENWQILEPLRLFKFELMMSMAFERRAYCAMGMAAVAMERGQSAEPYLGSAERDARNLERWNTSWGPFAAHLVRAGVAAHRGDRAQALERLTIAEAAFAREGMALHRTVSRWRRGSLLSGDAGRALVQESREWMLAQGVKNPDRLNRVYAPGVWAQTADSAASTSPRLM
jgi:eukaryotic-like serine/threonine-protein kinase